MLGGAANERSLRGEATVVTAAEVRARVARADQQRIARRAEAAAVVHELARRRDVVQAELAAIDRELGAAVRSAEALLSLAELSVFLGRSPREVAEWAQLAPRRRGRGAAASLEQRQGQADDGVEGGSDSTGSGGTESE